MMNYGVIQRALGMIEGVSYGIDKAAADTLLAAVAMIDLEIEKEVNRNGKGHQTNPVCRIP